MSRKDNTGRAVVGTGENSRKLAEFIKSGYGFETKHLNDDADGFVDSPRTFLRSSAAAHHDRLETSL